MVITKFDNFNILNAYDVMLFMNNLDNHYPPPNFFPKTRTWSLS